MRLLVVSDLHQNIDMIDKLNKAIESEVPDHLLFLGDITDLGTSDDAIDILKGIKSKSIFAIPGNCDPLDLPERMSDVVNSVHGRSLSLGGCNMACLGGSNITIFNTPFELNEETIYNALKPISKKGMILMVHVPAFGILDHIPNGMSVGSHSVKRIVDEFSPMLVLSGHIHEDFGIETINGTTFVNPGPLKDGRYAVVDIDGNKVETSLNVLD